MALLEVQSLTVASGPPGGAVAKYLDNVSLTVGEGELVGLVGESGSGKTTLLRAVLGLNARGVRVDSGRVTLEGAELPLANDDRMREIRGGRVALVQSGQRSRLDPVRRVGQQLEDAMRAHERIDRQAQGQRARDLLRSVGIADVGHRVQAYPHELSGGMCQRVVIALALANFPKLLMADDPTAGLDVTIQLQILDLFRSLVRETKSASLLTTRDLAQVAHYCDRVIVLQHGSVVEDATVEEFFSAPATAYGRSLLSAAVASRATRDVALRRPSALAAPPGARPGGSDPGSAEPSEEVPLLEVIGLVKHYRSHGEVVHAVNGVSFAIERGRTLALVGESGSGKTTVGQCIVGLVEPTEGEIRLSGRRLAHLGRRRAAGQESFDSQIVFQEPWESLNPRWTLARSIEEPLKRQKRANGHERSTRVAEILELVAVPAAAADRYPHEVPPGVLQRVAIARAIATNPLLVVLDEPTSSLDISVKAQVIDLLVDLQERLKLTYLFISHDMAAVRAIAHEVAIMYLGRVLEFGPAADVFESQVNPYGRALLSSVLYPELPAARTRFELRGEIPSAIQLPPGCPLYSRCPLALTRCNEVVPSLEPVGENSLSACIRTEEILRAGGIDALARSKSQGEGQLVAQ